MDSQAKPQTPPQPRALMFADISGSSSLYKQLGNQGAKASIDKTLAAMIAISEQHQGKMVKTIGDEIMVRFDCPSLACQCAQSLQQQLNSVDQLLPVRIGMAYGDTLLEQQDVFGNIVNDAAFMANIARAQQIIITQGLYDAISTDLQADCHEFDRIRLKGAKDRHTIYRLSWESPAQDHSATTVMSIHEITQQADKHCMTLVQGNHRYQITPEQTPFVLGRNKNQSDLHLNNDLASREHCQIVFRRGKFVLVDHSTNGTYVSSTSTSNKEIYIRREELPLQGQGNITIGQPLRKSGEDVIGFFV